ncbi:MAG: FlgD immunoglobulin-like domain containing protein [Patescibacteria group bacterium]|jgi:hypothetical protein
MRRPAIITVVLLAMLAGPVLGANQSPKYHQGLLFAPYNWALQNYSNFCLKLTDQGKTYVVWANDEGDNAPDDATVDRWRWYCKEGSIAMYFVDTHSWSTAAAFEAYSLTGQTERNNAITAYEATDDWAPGDLWPGQTSDGYDICINPTKISWLLQSGLNTIAIVDGCFSAGWIGTGFANARVAVGFSGSTAGNIYTNTMLSRMNGEGGANLRSASSAIAGIGSGLTYTGSGETVFSPVVTDVNPDPGTLLNDEKTDGWIEFDSAMDTNQDVATRVQASGWAYLTDFWWSGDHRLNYKINLLLPGDFTITCADLTDGSNAILDGNQNPYDTNGQGPNGDDYVYSLASGYTSPNTAATFTGVWAFRDIDGIHVLWLTDPELGSINFQVWGGEHREQLLTTVPAEGGVLPHFYEVVVQSTADFLEVAEKAKDPTTETSSRPFPVSPVPPPELASLRKLNQTVSTWQPTPYTPELPQDRSTTTVLPASHFTYYTSQASWVTIIQPIINYWAQWGWNSQVIVGSNDPNAAKSTFRAAYDANVAAGCSYPPFCTIVGEANQGDRPAANIVGTFYIPDENQQCYWNSCGSDLQMVNFFDEGPECYYSRVYATTTQELNNCVTSTLQYYNGQYVSSPRALAIVGDLSSMCHDVPAPRLLFQEIGGWYTGAGVPFTQLNETSTGCYDYLAKRNMFVAAVQSGVTEIIGTGSLTTREIWPGFFAQLSMGSPLSMSLLPTKQRIVLEFPGCDMADGDRNNPTYYPPLTKRWMVNDPAAGASAVLELSHSRGGSQAFHHRLAREYFSERISPGHWCAQEVYQTAIKRLWKTESMRTYLKLAMAYGFPIPLHDFLSPAGMPDFQPLPDKADLQLTNAPNPGRTTELRYDLPGMARVSLTIYGVSGQRVRTLVTPNVIQSPGSYSLTWDGQNDNGARAQAGVYFVRLELDGRIVTSHKVTLL